jgi:acetyl esterase/lipase
MGRYSKVLVVLTSVAGLSVPGALVQAPSAGAQPEGEQPFEDFTGTVEEFYEVPDPLPAGEPGDLIRVQAVDDTADEVTVRVMYHTRDARERDRVSTGIITYPTGEAPDGGWPVLSWAHGGISMASQCAPSRAGLQPAPAFGVEGVRVATDYLGMGPVGEITPVLSKASAGNSVIDAVRAARQLAEANAGTTWLSIGHSAGGHGALAAHELADSYAPELDHVGTVSIAPAAVFDQDFGDEVVTSVVAAAMLYGAPSEHPEIIPEDYAGEELEALGDLIRTGCQPEFETLVAATRAATGDDFWENDPWETEPAASLLGPNDVGNDAADAPLLLASGTVDPIVVIDRVRALYDRYCAAGQVTDYHEIEGADHGTEIPMFSEQIESWLADRLDSGPVTNSCTDQPSDPAEPGDQDDPGEPSTTPAADPVIGVPTFTG